MYLVAAILKPLGHVISRVLMGLQSSHPNPSSQMDTIDTLGHDCVQGTSLLRALCPVTDSVNQNVYVNKNQVPWPEWKGMLS